MSAPAESVPGQGPADRRNQDMAPTKTRTRGTTRQSKPDRRQLGAVGRPWKTLLVAGMIAASLAPAACSGNFPGPAASPTTNQSSGTSSHVPNEASGSPSPSASSPTASPSASPSPTAKPASALAEAKAACPSLLSWDNFHRSNRSLHRDRLPTGQRYYASGPDAQRISHDRYVSQVEPNIPDLLYVWLQRRPTTLAARWVFTPGKTGEQHTRPPSWSPANAVIGVAPRHAVIGHRHLLGFGIGSVQLAVYPDFWWFFYLTNPDYKVQVHNVAMANFNRPLKQDGRTIYQMSMSFDSLHSSVTVEYPGGRRRFQNPAFNQLWGRLYGLQVRRGQSSDGNVRFVAAASSSERCSARLLLGPMHR